MISRPRFRLLAAEIIGTALIVGGVLLFTELRHSFYVPTLPAVLTQFHRIWIFNRFGSDVVPSLIRLSAGLALSMASGLVLGLLLAHYRRLRLMTKPIMAFLLNMPPPALLPIFIIFLGIGDSMKIVVIFSLCVWPMLYNTMEGVLELDQTLVSTAAVYRISGPSRLWNVLLPAIAPRIFVGVRISLSSGLLILIVSEMVASTKGIGYFVLQSQTGYAIPEMWAGILLLGLLGYLLNGAALLLERRVLRWHQSQRSDAS